MPNNSSQASRRSCSTSPYLPAASARSMNSSMLAPNSMLNSARILPSKITKTAPYAASSAGLAGFGRCGVRLACGGPAKPAMLTASIPSTATPRIRSSEATRLAAALGKRSVPDDDAGNARGAEPAAGGPGGILAGKPAGQQPGDGACRHQHSGMARQLRAAAQLAPQGLGITRHAECAELDPPVGGGRRLGLSTSGRGRCRLCRRQRGR